MKKESVEWSQVESEIGTKLLKGGHFKPSFCVPINKVAFLIPFRDRDEHLRIFLYHMHPFLQRQGIEYKMYIINQVYLSIMLH